MKLPTLSGRLRETSALVALSAATIFGCAAPSAAVALEQGIYGGGSTLASQALRQLFDCYSGKTIKGDGFAFGAVKPGFLPKTCTTATHANPGIEGLYAAVGSGSGQAAFFANDFLRLLQSHGQTPATPPPFVDSGSTDSNFNEYPYPRIDFGAGDSPLGAKSTNGNGYSASFADLTSTDWGSFNTTTSWQTLTTVTVGSTFTVTYPQPTTVTLPPTSWGNPIQIPMFEAPVSIILNVGGLTIQTGLGTGGAPNNKAGGAIALTTAQLCAIFSGLVIDWSDTTTSVPYIDKTGVQVNASSSTAPKFFTPNFFTNTGPAAVPYAASSVPLKVVYRSDGSGTSFILTNFLQSSCPQLDGLNSTSGIYHSIFGAGSGLPSTSFSTLITSVNTFWRANGRGTSYDITPTWDGQSGSQGVAGEVGNTTGQPTHGGYIGYVSADFSSPYSTITNPPDSASVQNEAQRIAGHYFPSTTSKFVAPSGTSVDGAFANIVAPTTTSSFAKWDLYGIVYPTETKGGVKYGGISQLGLPNSASAYPIAGTTFAYLYSSYAGANETQALGDFFAWLLGASVSTLPVYDNGGATPSNRSNPGRDADVTSILSNNGFHPLHIGLAKNLLTEYIVPSASTHFTGSASAFAAFVPGGPQVDGCTNVLSGANPGAL
jgi:ABC-type phosphate transport system substrate-binding protein